MILRHQDHFQKSNKYEGKNSKKNYKTLKNPSKTWKKELNILSDIHNLSHIHQLSLTCFGSLRLIFALYFTYTKNKILLLDPTSNENSDVSFAPHKTTKNTTTFLAFTKNSDLKWKEILKIDRLKCPKSFISNEK